MPMQPFTQDFSSTMAQMIARSRTPQAPGGGGHGVVRAPARSRSSNVQATADVGGLVEGLSKVFGWKTPEEKEQIAADLQKAMEARTPQDRDTLLMEPTSQMMLESLEKSGSPISRYGFSRSGEKTPLGRPVYRYVPISEEAKARGLTKEQIAAGGAGAGPREKLMEFEEAGKPFEPEKFIATAPPDKVSLYFTRKAEEARQQALAKETPLDKRVKESQATMHESAARQANAAAAYDAERTRYLPDEQKRLRDVADAQIKHYNSEAYKNYKMGDWYKEDKGIDREKTEAQKSVNDVYRQSLAIWNKTTSMTTQPIEMDKQMDELYGIVTAHVHGSDAALGHPRTGNESFAFWTTRVSDEVSKGVRQKGWIVKGPDPASEVRLQKYAQRTWQLMTTMGQYLNPNLAEVSLQNIASIYAMTSPTPAMNTLAQAVVEYGRVIGIRVKGLEELIQERSKPTARPEDVYPELTGGT